MQTHWFADGLALYNYDCRKVLPVLGDASVDSVCTDPPYEIGFMGKTWDAGGAAYDVGTWKECFRVLKPGGYLVAFGGTRTYHRLASAIEDAGFEIRDSLHWVYGSGFPKSLDVSKAIDKAAGAQREVVGRYQYPDGSGVRAVIDSSESASVYGSNRPGGSTPVTAPATPDAARWEGWGTALKPAHEPIVLARKPLAGTVAQNVLAHGTGALNVDGCRVGANGEYFGGGARMASSGETLGKFGEYVSAPNVPGNDSGRWPPNVLLTHAADCKQVGTQRQRTSSHSHGSSADVVYGSETGATYMPQKSSGGQHMGADGMETVQVWDCAPGCPVAGLDGQSAPNMHGAGSARAAIRAADNTGMFPLPGDGQRYGDTGGASRFFPQLNWSPEYDLPFLYQAKASAKERPRHADGSAHPTVKPLALMRWLARLVTPPGGTVLDPFAGTGTTLQAARLEGFRSIGCDSWDQAAEMACQRLGLAIEADAG